MGLSAIPNLDLDTALLIAGNAGEAAVLMLLLYRRAWRTLPFFCLYSAWTLLGSAAAYAVRTYLPAAYLATYLLEAGLDFGLQFCVLVELAWSIFRPFRASLPRATVPVLAGLIALLAVAVWPFTDSSAFAHFPPQWHLLVRLQQNASILRVIFFLVLAGCSQLLSIGWRDRELQVATGLGFYSFIGLTATVIHSYQAAGAQYRRVDQFLVASYIVSLLYWVFCFAQQEEARRDFSPQMQSLLAAVAGTARSTRVVLAESTLPKQRKNGDP